MALAYAARNGTKSGAGTASFAVPLSPAIASGSLIIVSVMTDSPLNANDVSVTDSAGNTYSSANHSSDGANVGGYVWYCPNCLALTTSQTVTVTFPGGAPSFAGVAVDTVTGAATSSPTDGSTNSGTIGTAATTYSTGSITTANANDLLWAILGSQGGDPATIANASSSPTSGWTTQTAIAPTSGDTLRTAYQIVSATGTYHADGALTSGGFATAVIVAFKQASGGGTAWNQSLADKQSATDVSTRASRKALADAQSALDAATKLVSSLRGDTHSALDVLTKLYTTLRTDAFSLVDALAKMPAHTLLDGASSKDSLNAFKPSGVSWNQTLTDKHSALDVVARQITKLNADQISALDTFAHTWVARLVLADLFTETDVQSKQLARTLLDTHVAQDILQKLAQHSLQEAHSATDARTSLILHALAETLSATDTQTRSYSKGLFDALSQTDRLTAGRLLLLSLLDAFSLTDSAGQPQLAHPLAASKIGVVASLVASLVGIQVTLQLGVGVTLAPSLLPVPVGLQPLLLPSAVAVSPLLTPVPIGLVATLV